MKTIYIDLWYQVIARPRYDRRLADSLRRAHNRIVYGKQKAVDVPVALTEQVAALSQNKATAKRVSAGSGFYDAEMRS